MSAVITLPSGAVVTHLVTPLPRLPGSYQHDSPPNPAYTPSVLPFRDVRAAAGHHVHHALVGQQLDRAPDRGPR
jgi:hypothetical protein